MDVSGIENFTIVQGIVGLVVQIRIVDIKRGRELSLIAGESQLGLP